MPRRAVDAGLDKTPSPVVMHIADRGDEHLTQPRRDAYQYSLKFFNLLLLKEVV
jgi:hypothetical protein